MVLTFTFYFLVNVYVALFLSLGKSERLELLPPRGWNKSVKLMIYQSMSVYVDVGSKVSPVHLSLDFVFLLTDGTGQSVIVE